MRNAAETVLGIPAYLRWAAVREEFRVSWAVGVSVRDHAWRRAVQQALRDRDEFKKAEDLDQCLARWSEGRPTWVCKRYRYCLSCLRFRLRLLYRRDLANLQRTPPPLLARVTSERHAPVTSSAWRGAVLGYRRLCLPRRRLFTWIVAARDLAPVERAVPGPVRRHLALTSLERLYEEPLEELVLLGAEEAVVRALAAPRRQHMFASSGLFRRPIKLPRRPRRVAVRVR